MAQASIDRAGSTLTIDDLRGDRGRTRKEAVARGLLSAAGGFSILISVLIVYSLVRETWTFVTQVDWSLVWGDGWFPRRAMYDIKTLVVGSLIVTVVGIAVAGPIGVGAAIYLSEYASRRVRRFVKPTIEILAGVPSVVVGFFALTFISPELIQRFREGTPQQTMFAAGIGVGVLIIPLVASISEDAMRSVPRSLREASYGMGAKKATTVTKVVLPAAVSGLVAAFIVAVSRAIGETMVVFIAAGKSGGALFETNPFEPGLTMTAAMASIASGTDSVVGEALTFQSLFFVGMLLFVITLSLNMVADRFVRRVRHKY
ncbi:MAG: phosphate ABC transporter permease subunit PstC [Actinobacteria bacterium]|nr:phosphate ABC transporter permease subunit PstC [Actinomycetota bacterium]